MKNEKLWRRFQRAFKTPPQPFVIFKLHYHFVLSFLSIATNPAITANLLYPSPRTNSWLMNALLILHPLQSWSFVVGASYTDWVRPLISIHA